MRSGYSNIPLLLFLLLLLASRNECLQSSYKSTTRRNEKANSNLSFSLSSFTRLSSIQASSHSFEEKESFFPWRRRRRRNSGEGEGEDELVPSPVLARLYILLCAFLYGSTYSFTKSIQNSNSISPQMLSFLRFTIASICYAPIPFLRRSSSSSSSSSSSPFTLTSSNTFSTFIRNLYSRRQLWLGAIQIGAWSSAAFISQSISLNHSSASKVAFYASLAAVLSPLIEVISSFKNRFTYYPKKKRQQLIRLQSFVPPILALLGVLCLECYSPIPPNSSIFFISTSSSSSSSFLSFLQNEALLLLSPISVAMSCHKSDKLDKLYPNSSHSITAIQLITIALFSLLWLLFSYGNSLSLFQIAPEIIRIFSCKRQLAGILYVSLATTVFTFYAEQQAIKSLSAGMLYFWLNFTIE